MMRAWFLIAILGACKGESKPGAPATGSGSAAPVVAAAPAPAPITDVAGYKAALQKLNRAAEGVYDRDGTDCAKIIADLKALGPPPDSIKAFEAAHPDAIDALERDEAWGDAMKASALHGLKAMEACGTQAGFMEANAGVYGD